MQEHNEPDKSAILKKAGFRATKPRILLLELLGISPTPLSIHEIVTWLRDHHIDQVTVYRSIEAFTRAGIIREIDFRGQYARYELPDTERDHHHIVCTKCHKIEDFIDTAHENIEKRVLAKSKSFRRITSHSFDLYGLCNTCAK